MLCRCCETEGSLIKAHIIPDAFFRRMRDAEGIPKLLSNNDAEYPKRIPGGVYDSGILCAACEPMFGPWDQYAVELLRDDLPGARTIREGERVLAHEIDNWQYQTLKLFFVSLAWRASVSTHPMFRRIRLGPYEARAKDMLLKGQPGEPTDFGVVVSRFDPGFGGAMMDPFAARSGGTNYVRFYLGTFMADISVDRRPLPAPLPELSLSPGLPLRIVERDFLNSREFPILWDIATKPKNRRSKAKVVRPAG